MKQSDNYTVRLMRNSALRFKRRLDIPMWNAKHVTKTIEILAEVVEELRRIDSSSSLRNEDKCRYSQDAIQNANMAFKIMTPQDPRPRGAELLVYGNRGLEDERGYAELNAREDLNTGNVHGKERRFPRRAKGKGSY